MTRPAGARLAAALLTVTVLSACGSGDRPAARIQGTTLTIYFSGPLHGASSVAATAALNGARIALAGVHDRVGKYRIVLRPLDDSTPQSDGWDPSQTTLNARAATQDPTTIGYIGDFNSGAAAVSIPLLNRAGIAQVSSGSTAVGLTTAGPGAAPGEPQKYYPVGNRTFARVVPTDAAQARALVRLQQTLGCASTFVLDDGEVDGEDTALTFVLTAKSAGLRVVGVQSFQRRAADYGSLAASVAGSGANCVVISAIDEASSALLAKQVAHALPDAAILATGALADSAFTDPAAGGIPASIDARVLLVSAMIDAGAYPPAGRAFLSTYARAFGVAEPSAIYGYAAMNLMLHAIARATDGGHRAAYRAKVVQALIRTPRLRGPLGAYRIDSAGDTTIGGYGTDRIIRGHLAYIQKSS